MHKMVKSLLLSALLTALPASADVTLKLTQVLTSPARTAALQTLIDRFSEANPDISVEITVLPWEQAFAELAAMVSSGNIPDVVEMPDTWVRPYIKNQLLENLDPYLQSWPDADGLSDITRQMARRVNDTAYMVPYGFYLRALYYNKKLFEQAGIDGPPQTMDDFMATAEKIAQLPDKYGYCMRGGSGGINAWLMFASAMNGTSELFDDKRNSRLNEPGSIAGLQFMIDLYHKGYAPKDSIGWGAEETMAGFSSGSCAMLDQDSDALMAVAASMKADEFAVAPMPLGPAGKAFPTIGFAGWSMFSTSEYKEEAWQLIAYLSGRESNFYWSTQTGVIPIHQDAGQEPYFATEQFAGWFTELNDERYVPTVMPAYLEEWGQFSNVIAKASWQEALLNVMSAEGLANRWAEVLTEAYKKWLRTGR